MVAALVGLHRAYTVPSRGRCRRAYAACRAKALDHPFDPEEGLDHYGIAMLDPEGNELDIN